MCFVTQHITSLDTTHVATKQRGAAEHGDLNKSSVQPNITPVDVTPPRRVFTIND
jgi:hypothetical protein